MGHNRGGAILSRRCTEAAGGVVRLLVSATVITAVLAAVGFHHIYFDRTDLRVLQGLEKRTMSMVRLFSRREDRRSRNSSYAAIFSKTSRVFKI
jgi:hypothetical protein